MNAYSLTDRGNTVDEELYRQLQTKVFLRMCEVCALWSMIVFLVEVFVRGLTSIPTLGVGVTVILTLILYFHARITGDFKAGAVGIFLIVIISCSGFELVDLKLKYGIRMTQLGMIVSAALLLGRVWAQCFYILSLTPIFLISILSKHAVYIPGFVFESMSVIFVGGVVLYVCDLFESGRKEAYDEARIRELDLQIANREANEALRARRRFLANMSHEIRTPMNSISGNIRSLEAELEPGISLDMVRRIRALGDDVLQLLDCVIELSRLDSDSIPLNQRACQVEKVINRINNRLSRRDNRPEEIEIKSSTLPGDWYMFDYECVVKVLWGTVTVLLKERRMNMKIDVDYGSKHLFLRISVSAHESDMAIASNLSRVEELLSYDKPCRDELVLSLIVLMVQRLGGRLTYIHDVGSRETAVEVEIPTKKTKPPQNAHVTKEKSDFGRLRVLVAEDDRVNQMVVKRTLKRFGVTPDIVGNGQEAVDAVQKHIYDLVFMDLHMPEKDGIQATREIRSMDESKRSVPIVALTASLVAQDHEASMEAGMNDYLTKPIDLERIEDVLRECATAKAV